MLALAHPTWVVIGVAVVLVAVIVRVLHRRRRLHVAATASVAEQQTYDLGERAHMPEELRHAALHLSETTLYADLPVKLAARMDQVFSVQSELVPMESKTRERLEVDPSDVLQLSVQAVVLANSTDPRVRGRRVAAYGYVRIVRQGQPPVYLRTTLVNEQTIANYHRRYHALRQMKQPAGQIGLRGAISQRVCRRCPYQVGCPYQPAR